VKLASVLVEGERGAGGIREAGVDGVGSGIPKVAGSGRNRESYPTLHNILQSKKDQEVEDKKIGRKVGGLNPPVPLPPC